MPSYVRGSDNFDSAQVLGQNQTWQDVTSSRVLGVTYTNSSGKPIYVSIKCYHITANAVIEFVVAGIYVARYQAYTPNAGGYISAVIPNGATYTIPANSGANIIVWAELR